jgi:hypothetical protein
MLRDALEIDHRPAGATVVVRLLLRKRELRLALADQRLIGQSRFHPGIALVGLGRQGLEAAEILQRPHRLMRQPLEGA